MSLSWMPVLKQGGCGKLAKQSMLVLPPRSPKRSSCLGDGYRGAPGGRWEAPPPSLCYVIKRGERGREHRKAGRGGLAPIQPRLNYGKVSDRISKQDRFVPISVGTELPSCRDDRSQGLSLLEKLEPH